MRLLPIADETVGCPNAMVYHGVMKQVNHGKLW